DRVCGERAAQRRRSRGVAGDRDVPAPSTGGRRRMIDPELLPTAVLGARFSEAVRWAAMLHADDVRKGTRIAYVSHLLGVASLVVGGAGDGGGGGGGALAA